MVDVGGGPGAGEHERNPNRPTLAEVTAVVDAIDIVSRCAVDGGKRVVARSPNATDFVYRLMRDIDLTGTVLQEAVGPERAAFLVGVHTSLMGREDRGRFDLMCTALWGDQQLGVPRIDDALQGWIQLIQQSDGETYLQLDAARMPLDRYPHETGGTTGDIHGPQA